MNKHNLHKVMSIITKLRYDLRYAYDSKDVNYLQKMLQYTLKRLSEANELLEKEIADIEDKGGDTSSAK